MEFYLRDGSMAHAGKRWLLLIQLTLALAPYKAQSTTFKITAPYSLYVCPEGQNVTLTCKFSGSIAVQHDSISSIWYVSHQGDQSCSQKKHIRNFAERQLHYEQEKHHGLPSSNSTAKKNFHGQQTNHHGVKHSTDKHGIFYITIANLTLQDSGNYCCYAVEHNKAHLRQQAHSFMELHIQKDITAAALATGACIVGILCLPLILLLIYKQRQAIHSRRAHELVRMDSNAQGIENPVFDDVPANSESKPRPQLTYMASHQQSESGRHLLSEPNTPLSPPVPGDCFFPSLEPVPDSPNLINV
ncbi:V-type immunoglobulin domain-containing suppressor of T-cell activation isoform X2 [Hemicordylus capensis]|uniref:V-type immunoglobulin domain-containing suppressor of T-cell activation isoform X2 n=1 Tax=Hemicordylus capensis TaxID=884348 RepID=UPI0023024656|nr:V-type immunoglobulin domain-containing suppressor of T-cell activation isoform X2 [Hemicordylus capensis]